MCFSSHSNYRLQPVNYPIGGIDSPGWTKLSPDVPCFWQALALVLNNEIAGHYFLGAGHSSLDLDESIVGAVSVVCVKGYVYLVNDSGVFTLPSKLRGYTHVTSSNSGIAFSNYSELLVIEPTGMVRYDEHLAIDDLEILRFDADTVQLSGLRRYGGLVEEWAMRVDELPCYRRNHL